MCDGRQETSPILSDGASNATWELSSTDDGALGSPREQYTFSIEMQKEQRRREKELEWAVKVGEMYNEIAWDPKEEKQVLKMLLSEARRRELSTGYYSDPRKYPSLLSQTTSRAQLLGCYTFLPPPNPAEIYIDPFSQTLRRQAMLSRLKSSGSLFLDE
eukprot:TRINITY_DN7236_c0_g4_i1.p1 TRINITY_DN7236_c0_g4~~TRINITY_DN7236_c0_g4_i1.p1  ORF type:complete len:159 (+),score=31.31 TRINITY_DN7236_c0_g4_i1:59-535(+)